MSTIKSVDKSLVSYKYYRWCSADSGSKRKKYLHNKIILFIWFFFVLCSITRNSYSFSYNQMDLFIYLFRMSICAQTSFWLYCTLGYQMPANSQGEWPSGMMVYSQEDKQPSCNTQQGTHTQTHQPIY